MAPLRTLLILLAVLPPLLWIGWTKYEAWRAERELQQARQRYWLESIKNTSPPTYLSPSQPQDTTERAEGAK
jgi:hypothetical protein